MNLLKTFFGIGGMTTISRILGFIRDTVIARIIFEKGYVTLTPNISLEIKPYNPK